MRKKYFKFDIYEIFYNRKILFQSSTLILLLYFKHFIQKFEYNINCFRWDQVIVRFPFIITHIFSLQFTNFSDIYLFIEIFLFVYKILYYCLDISSNICKF